MFCIIGASEASPLVSHARGPGGVCMYVCSPPWTFDSSCVGCQEHLIFDLIFCLIIDQLQVRMLFMLDVCTGWIYHRPPCFCTWKYIYSINMAAIIFINDRIK